VEVHSPWPWASLVNLKIRDSVLDLEFEEKGVLNVRINGREMESYPNGKAELPWNLFMSQEPA
jgi:hypothetical protein